MVDKMAYDRIKIFEQAKEVIVKHKLFFMDEVPDFLPCSRSTFYDFFPNNSDELDSLKELILINKTQIKTSMRSKWYQSDNPTLQMGLMKLIASPEELRKLSMNHQVTEEVEKPIFKELDLDVTSNDSTD
jgi:hypothetical protein